MKKSLFLIPLFITIVLLLPLTDCTHSSSGGSYDSDDTDPIIYFTGNVPEAAAYISELTGNGTYGIIVVDNTETSCASLYEVMESLGCTEDSGPRIILDLSKATLLEIGESAFYGNDKEYRYALKEIILPENCTSVGNGAFEGQASLEKVTFPETLKIIDQYAFANCGSLKEVDLSPCTKLEEVWDCAFQYCTSLEKVDMSQCKALCYIGQNAFHKSYSITVITIYSANDGKAWGHIGYNTDGKGSECEHIESSSLFVEPTEDNVTIVPCFTENTLWFLTTGLGSLNCTEECSENCSSDECNCKTSKSGYEYHWYKL